MMSVFSMSTQRAHILLPEDLITEIDALVGPRGRSAFLVEVAREAVKRRKLLALLEAEEPAWKPTDHPEWTGDAHGWVAGQRGKP